MDPENYPSELVPRPATIIRVWKRINRALKLCSDEERKRIVKAFNILYGD